MSPRALILLALVALPAAAKPPELADRVEAPRPAGCHDYGFLMWDLYRAELWTDAAALPGESFALSLTYRTEFAREALLESTIDQMARFVAGAVAEPDGDEEIDLAGQVAGRRAVDEEAQPLRVGAPGGDAVALGDITEGLRRALATPGVAPILGFGFLNALPVAVTSTLFLFFVTDVLGAGPRAGPTLLLFFAAAAGAAPLWARLARRLGRRPALAFGMSLSVLAFAWAATLGAGDIAAFYLIAAGSGAALGADLTLPPAMLAARIAGDGGRVFALWTFLQKSALAAAAGVVLPALALAGYDPAAPDGGGRAALSVAYTLVPCALKLAAIAALALIPDDKEPARATP